MSAYAGIGSRGTPEDVLNLMYHIAKIQAQRGMVLRSGGAEGADTAFYQGCLIENGHREIYIPWNGFNHHFGNQPGVVVGVGRAALDLAQKFHPNWAACSGAARTLHARNCYQVLGINLDDPVEGVVCWTKHGAGGGGTGQALRIAKHYNIPIYDLAIASVRSDIERQMQ